MKKPHTVKPRTDVVRRKELVRPLPRVEAGAVRPVAHLEERGAIRYPSLTSLSMESLSALLDEALRAVSRPAMAGAVGLAMMASGCVEPTDEPPAATLAPLGETQDMSDRDREAPPDLTLGGAGGWGSLGGSAGGGGGTGGAGGAGGSQTTPCDPGTDSTPCDPGGLGADVDGGADAGVDAGRHVIPTHNTPHLRGRMPLTRPIRTAGVPPRVDPMLGGSS